MIKQRFKKLRQKYTLCSNLMLLSPLLRRYGPGPLLPGTDERQHGGVHGSWRWPRGTRGTRRGTRRCNEAGAVGPR